MRVSVIIPTYNRAALLERAIDSVLRQTWEEWNLWVVDDGGDDDTADRVASQARGLPAGRINYIRTPHRGVSAARNTGVVSSSGPHLAFLDSDDEWVPEKLAAQIAYWDNLPEVPLVYSAETWIRGGKRVNPPQQYKGAPGRILDRSLRACVISPSSVMITREVFQRMGGFDESFPVCEDYDLWLRVCSRHDVGYVPRPLVVRHGGRTDQLSRITPAMDYWRVRAMVKLDQSATLTDDERAILIQELTRRGGVLLKGYKARGNTTMVDEVVALIRRAVPQFRTDQDSCGASDSKKA